MTVYIGTGVNITVQMFGEFNRKQLEAVTILQRHVKEVSYTFTGARDNGFATAEGQIVIEPTRDDALKLLNSRILGSGIGQSGPDIYVRVGYAGISTSLKSRGSFYKFQLPEFQISGENISITLPIFYAGYTATFTKQKRSKWENKTLQEIFNDILSNHGFEDVIINDSDARKTMQTKKTISQTEGDFQFLRRLCQEHSLDMFPFFGDQRVLQSAVNRMFIESYRHQNSQQPVATFLLWGMTDDRRKVFPLESLSSNLQHTQIPNHRVGVESRTVDASDKKNSKKDFNASNIDGTVVGDSIYDPNDKSKGPKGGIDTPEKEVSGRAYSMPSRDGKSKEELVRNRVDESINTAFELEVEGPGVGFILPGQLVTVGMGGAVDGIMKPSNYRVHSVTYSGGSDRGFRMAMVLYKAFGSSELEEKGVSVNKSKADSRAGFEVNFEER